MDYSKLTLGELLSSKDKTIRRNAVSILKQFQKTEGAIVECNHQFIDADNEGVYGYEECRFCGKREKK